MVYFKYESESIYRSGNTNRRHFENPKRCRILFGAFFFRNKNIVAAIDEWLKSWVWSNKQDFDCVEEEEEGCNVQVFV